jgi:hypothetical protein
VPARRRQAHREGEEKRLRVLYDALEPGQALEFRLKLSSGDHHIAVAIPRIFEGLPASYHGPNPSLKPEPIRAFTPPPNAPPERIAQLKQKFEETQLELQKIPLNGVRIGSVDVGGPYSQVSGPARASLARIYTCGHLHGGHQPICVRQIMTDLARRAFRRPVTSSEVQKYVQLVNLKFAIFDRTERQRVCASTKSWRK